MTSNEIDFTHIMEVLQKKAEEDGKVTEQEEDFLQRLGYEIKKYVTAVQAAQHDEVITEDEFQDLVLLRDNILTTAMNFDSESEDINKLVQELFNEIDKHELPGMADDELIGSDIEPED
ncbi:MAG: hypothetical protein ACXAE3_10855 [Candidatus Kariarchaeaceae archaeon]|jgi:hypothetical protein